MKINKEALKEFGIPEYIGKVNRVYIYEKYELEYKAIIVCDKGYIFVGIQEDENYEKYCAVEYFENITIEEGFTKEIIMEDNIYIENIGCYSSECSISLTGNKRIYLDIERDLSVLDMDEDDEDYIPYEATCKQITFNYLLGSDIREIVMKNTVRLDDIEKRYSLKDNNYKVNIEVELEELENELLSSIISKKLHIANVYKVKSFKCIGQKKDGQSLIIKIYLSKNKDVI